MKDDVVFKQKRAEICEREMKMREDMSSYINPDASSEVRLYQSLDYVVARVDNLLDLMCLDMPELVEKRRQRMAEPPNTEIKKKLSI